jgi:uncharacterized protein YbjT (DUF2867 family)
MILVTGATGKVGRHLVAGLLAAGAPVRALTRDPAAANLPAGAELVRFDPARPQTATATLAGATAVFLNATAVGRVLGQLMAAASRARVRRAVLLSSFTVRDNGAQPYAIGRSTRPWRTWSPPRAWNGCSCAAAGSQPTPWPGAR